jgi:hypothetical protein
MADPTPTAAFKPLTDKDWGILLRRIDGGQCTLFLGGNAGLSGVPTKSEIARRLAADSDYPLDDTDNLARVCQYIAATVNPLEPKDRIREFFRGVPTPEVSRRDNAYRKLAELPFSIYVVTGFDSYLVSALISAKRDPRSEICRWQANLSDLPSALDGGYVPSVANPLVFHIYGNIERSESLVVTEDDFMDFLVNTSRESTPKPIPEKVQAAFASNSLLFFGYHLEDLEFRVLVRRMLLQLGRNGNRSHVSVQLINVVDNLTDTQKKQMQSFQEYLSVYCSAAPLFMKVCWGGAAEFAVELHRRWEDYRARR